MKTAEEIARGHLHKEWTILAIEIEEYASQFKPKWISVEEVPEDGEEIELGCLRNSDRICSIHD